MFSDDLAMTVAVTVAVVVVIVFEVVVLCCSCVCFFRTHALHCSRTLNTNAHIVCMPFAHSRPKLKCSFSERLIAKCLSSISVTNVVAMVV